ncbi:branched-chain amino acid ABC transporter permease [Thermodesulfobacteriota bacterium]
MKKRRQDKEQEIHPFWIVCLLLGIILLPLFPSKYVVYLANLMGIAVIGSVGLNLLMGYTGQVSIGHAAFMAIGAYASTILQVKTGLPFWVALPMGGAFAAIIGLVVGVPCLRLSGLYLAIATMGFGFIIETAIVYWRGMTNGAEGLVVQRAVLGSITINTDRSNYFLIYAVVVILVYLAKNIEDSRTGRAFVSIRDSEEAAQTTGVSLFKYKLLAFAISSFYAGVAGGLFANLIGFISPENFDLMLSIQYLVMLVVGGLGSLWGAILGAMFITLLPEGIRFIKPFLPQALAVNQGFYPFIYGMTMIIFMIFEPQGLYGRWLKIKIYYKLFPLSPKQLKKRSRWR